MCQFAYNVRRFAGTKKKKKKKKIDVDSVITSDR